jgi:hypothetical protein
LRLVTVVVVDEPSLLVTVVVEVVVTIGLCDAERIIGSSTHLPVCKTHREKVRELQVQHARAD